jgi:hypothetical protein
MAKANRDGIEKWRTQVLTDYLEEMERVRCMAKVDFKVTQACSCCGEVGYVPTHHRFLCVFCWVTASLLATPQDVAEDSYTRQGKGEESWDKVRSNIPIGIEGTEREPDVYYTLEFNARDYTQAELQAMIP